jgi:hypothetical protein
MTELLLFAALGCAVFALCIALDNREERRDARRRNQARPWR